MNFFSSNVFEKFVFLFLFLSLFSGVYSIDVEVTINESSSLTKLSSGSYSLIADGILEIRNPSLISKVYEFNFPITLDALIGINKVNLPDVVIVLNGTTISIPSNSEKFDFNFERIKGYMIEPNQTIKVGYHIYGLLSYDLYSKINSKNITVLEYYIDSFDFASNVIMNLQKVQREGSIYNNDGPIQSLNSSPIFSNSTRLVSAGIRNPTEYDYFIRTLKLFKTDVSDPYYDNGDLIKTFKNVSISPFEFKQVDFLDSFSDDSSVYWVSSDVVIVSNIINDFTRYFINQKSTSDSSTSDKSGITKYFYDDDLNLNSILIKKDVDKTFIQNGDEFEVSLTIVNINDFKIENLSLFDEVPIGYEIKSVSESVKINGGNLEFEIGVVEKYSSIEITYILINKEKKKGITYLKPAKLVYDFNDFFSQGIILINDILADKKVFIQKEIKIIDENYARVIIRVKNLGSMTIEDLLVADNIDDNAIIKEISKLFFQRGSWKIKELGAGEEWTVEYTIERIGNIDTLPGVYGIDQSSVFGTLISSSEVITIFKEDHKIIEKVGLGFAVVLLIFYLLF